jgi:DNA processing protein
VERREQAALLVALRRSGLTWAEVVARVEQAGSATAVLDELGSPEAPTFDDLDHDLGSARRAAESEIAYWAAEGIRLVTVLDDAYPAQLLTVHDHPPFLTYRGELDKGDAQGVAVVGTRQASDDGQRLASEVARALVESGWTVISGLAAGVDSAAHQAALDARGRTVAVIGTGLRRAYPAVNRRLQDHIAQRGLVLSQFWPDSPPSRQSFPMRNVVMSGYSLATVVIEASQTSGARMQARTALGHGRPAILMDRLLVHQWARDMAALPGVSVARSAADVLSAVEDIATVADAELTWV